MFRCQIWRSASSNRPWLKRGANRARSSLAMALARKARPTADFWMGQGEKGTRSEKSIRRGKQTAAVRSRAGGFTIFRRTASTSMGDLGVQPHVIEATLNHVSGFRAGVAGVYNRSSYAAEKRQALDLWAGQGESLISGQATNFVAMRA